MFAAKIYLEPPCSFHWKCVAATTVALLHLIDANATTPWYAASAFHFPTGTGVLKSALILLQLLYSVLVFKKRHALQPGSFWTPCSLFHCYSIQLYNQNFTLLVQDSRIASKFVFRFNIHAFLATKLFQFRYFIIYEVIRPFRSFLERMQNSVQIIF